MRQTISSRIGRVRSAVASARAVRRLIGRPAKAEEAVAGETPAARATSAIVMPLT